LSQSIADLEEKISEGNNSLDAEKQRYDFLLTEGLRLIALNASSQQNYSDTKKEMIANTEALADEINLKTEILKKLKEKQEGLQDDLKDILKNYKRIQEENARINKVIDGIRNQIADKIKESSNIDANNKKGYEELSSMEEVHQTEMEALQRELTELRELANHERNLKMTKQHERENKLNEIQTFNSETFNEQTHANAYLSQRRLEYNDLVAKNEGLEKYISTNEKLAANLKTESDALKKNLNSSKKDYDATIASLESEINSLTKEHDAYSAETNEISPSYEETMLIHAKTIQEFEEMKRNVILTKSRKMHIEDEIKKSNKMIREHKKSRDIFDKKLVEERQLYLNNMKRRNEETKLMEQTILNSGVRFDTLKAENERFREAIGGLAKEIEGYANKRTDTEERRGELTTELVQIETKLLNGWRSDNQIEKEFERNDANIILKLHEFFVKTRSRENKVHNVTDKMYKELEDFSLYITKMKGTGNRKSAQTFDTFSDRIGTTNTRATSVPRTAGTIFQSEHTMDAESMLGRVGTKD